MDELIPQGQLLRSAEAAKRLGVSRNTLLNMIEAGEITATRVRSEWRVNERDIAVYIERNTSVAKSEPAEVAS